MNVVRNAVEMNVVRNEVEMNAVRYEVDMKAVHNVREIHSLWIWQEAPRIVWSCATQAQDEGPCPLSSRS